jgi:hypothetical protein
MRLEDDMSLNMDIGGPPIPSSFASILELNGQFQNNGDCPKESIKMAGCRQNVNSGGNGAESSNIGLPYPNFLLWRGRDYKLLNDNFKLFRKAQIQVYMPEKPFDEDLLRDSNVGIIFLLDGKDHQ